MAYTQVSSIDGAAANEKEREQSSRSVYYSSLLLHSVTSSFHFIFLSHFSSFISTPAER